MEVKTGANKLASDQLENYLDIARQEGFDAVVTISNEIPAIAGQHPTKVPDHRIDHCCRPLKTVGERLTRNPRRGQREAGLGEAGRSRYFCRMKLTKLAIASAALRDDRVDREVRPRVLVDVDETQP